MPGNARKKGKAAAKVKAIAKPEAEIEAKGEAEIKEESKAETKATAYSQAKSAVPTCANCERSTGPNNEPLKACKRCQSVQYCSEKCQLDDFKGHIAQCHVPSPKSFLHPRMKGFFGNKPCHAVCVYRGITDCFLLRMADDFTYGGHRHGIRGQTSPYLDFQIFLDRAENARVLPQWWDAGERLNCEWMALTGANFVDIHKASTQAEILASYSNAKVVKELRIVSERIYGGGYGPDQPPMPAEHQCTCPPDSDSDSSSASSDEEM